MTTSILISSADMSSLSTTAAASLTESLGNRCRIEKREVVMQTPVIRPRLFTTAGYVENQLKESCTDLFDGRIASGDSARIDVDEIRPPACQF
jgi:hypothetical protein